jgi:predicted lipid-binding transport protein (Tim44 family)
MGEGFQFFDIILFAAIAAFLVLRLRSVLGKRTGHQERPSHDPFNQPQSGGRPNGQGSARDRDKVIPMPDRNNKRPEQEAEEVTDADLREAAEKADTPLSAGLTQIKLADRDFDEEGFVEGAKAAFEMVVTAYAEGDRETLKQLLANDVYKDFEAALSERERAGHTLETTLVNIREADIIEAELQQKTAFVTVKFVTEQINVVRDRTGEPIEGDPEHVADVTDIWTFARNTRSRDPNWTLVATRSPEEEEQA